MVADTAYMSIEFNAGDRVQSKVEGKGEGTILSVKHPDDSVVQVRRNSQAPTYTVKWDNLPKELNVSQDELEAIDIAKHEAPNWKSSDGKVEVVLDCPSPTECDIIDFRANPEGEGHGRRALEELRAQYQAIRAHQVGDKTREFWIKMGGEGLVDEAFNHEFERLWPPHALE